MDNPRPEITKRMIREWLGHNGSECRVKISMWGDVYRYGSPDLIDRSKDYWMYLGTFQDLVRDYARQHEMKGYRIKI